MATKHHPVWIGDRLHQFEDDRVEENKARLLKEAAAELLRCLDRRVKDAVGELRKRGFRLPGDQGDFCPLVFRYSSEVGR